jgi:hypothetical protein
MGGKIKIMKLIKNLLCCILILLSILFGILSVEDPLFDFTIERYGLDLFAFISHLFCDSVYGVISMLCLIIYITVAIIPFEKIIE